MPTPVSTAPVGGSNSGVQVGRPVASADLVRAATLTSFASSHNTHLVGAAAIHPRAGGRVQLGSLAGGWIVPMAYWRNPGAHVVAVVVHLGEVAQTTTGVSFELEAIELPSGATWLEANGLDGSVTFAYPPTGRIAPTEVVGWLDVTGVDPDTLGYFRLEVRPSLTGLAQPIVGVRLLEVPRAEADPTGAPTTDPTMELAAQLAPNPIVDGGEASPRGWARWAHVLDRARAGFRQHAQLVGVESADTSTMATSLHWGTDSHPTTGPLEWQFNESGLADVPLDWQLRNLYGQNTGDTADVRVVVRYRTSSLDDATLELVAEGRDGGTTLGAQSFVLPASTAWAWADFAATVPADGAGGWVRCTWLAAAGAGGEQVEFACLAVLEAQA